MDPADQVAANPGLKRRLKSLASNAFYRGWIGVVRGSERYLAGVTIPLIVVPATLAACARRTADYRSFREVRNVLPPGFWGRLGPREHYFRMLYSWYSTICACMCYDFMGSARWRRRVVVTGTPPGQLPGAADRPVIVTFLHTGAFGFLRMWLRSSGIRAVSYGAIPRVGHFGEMIHAMGDAEFGFSGLPHFYGHRDLKAVSRFLVAGNTLVIALDGAQALAPDPVEVDGRPIHLHDGPVRFALKSGALLMPAWIRQTGLFSFAVHYGRPVPAERMTKADTSRAVEWLAGEYWEGLRADPASIGWTTLEALAPDRAVARTLWP